MLFIGLDVGTTGVKALVLDENGRVYGSGYREYELVYEAGNRVTQNAEDWWTGTVEAVREATASVDCTAIRGIGLSTQGATMVAVDENGLPLGDALTWMDGRAVAQSKTLAQTVGEETVYRTCGWSVNPALDAAKLMWMREEQPDVFCKAACFVSTLEFMNYRLAGRFVIDPTNAAIRQLFNIETCDWDDPILNVVGITRARLPQVLPIGAPVGMLTVAAAEALGLPQSVTVFNGAHDQYCAAIGSGVIHAGDMLLATGTTWVGFGVTERPLFTESRLSPGIHPVKGRYGAIASLVSAGSALKWYKQFIGEDYRTMDVQAAKRLLSAKDLLFYPYLCGAGFPHGGSSAHGNLIGLSLQHDRYDVARALMEGVAFEAALMLDEYAKQGMDIHRLTMTGGASRSRLWCEIVGYVTGCRLFLMEEPETCCVGAGMLAAVGLGLFPDYAACAKEMVCSRELELPNGDLREFYKEKSARYREHLSKIH